MQKKQSELTVITKAKDLCTYVMTVTQKSPKHHDGFEASDVFFGVIHESGSDIDEAISADM